MHIDACSYTVSDPYCLLYYGIFFGMSVVGSLEKKSPLHYLESNLLSGALGSTSGHSFYQHAEWNVDRNLLKLDFRFTPLN